MTDPIDEIAGTLRSRLLRGLQAGVLRAGDRLPSTRELVAEFAVDHRTILAAYRRLADEGLLELRARGGIYVAPRPASPGAAALPEAWIVDVLTEGIARELSAAELHEWLRRCTETLRLRAVVVSSTSDQVAGLCRELRDDFGLEAEGLLADELGDGTAVPLPLRRADLIVATEAHAARAESLGAPLRRPVVVLQVRPDLAVGEWALLLRRPVYAVVATEAFGVMLREFFAGTPGVENLHVLVFGRDDLSAIPDGAPTYVTRQAREALGDTPVRGQLLPAARTIAPTSARALYAFIVRANLEAMGRLTR